MAHQKDFVTTNDNVNLEYIDTGEGPVIVMIPGGVGGPPEIYDSLIENLSRDHRTVCVGSRGTGLSGRPDWGFNVFRHARDIYDTITALDLEGVTLFGYSGGQDIVFAYYEIFRGERVSKLILGDNPPANVFHPEWSKERILNSGSYATPEQWYTFCKMVGDTSLLALQTSEGAEAVNGDHMIEMCVSHGGQDWMGLCGAIEIPSLIIRGKTSNNGTERGAKWMNWAIKGSRLAIIEGDHMTAMQGDGINDVIRDFIATGDKSFEADRSAALSDTTAFDEPFDEDAPIKSCAASDLEMLEQMIAGGQLPGSPMENVQATE
ncbi:alpha/beta hydrolase [Streptomyces sp. NBC_00075]|uniref:alpha/beta fold hydrolase n=1 Tax=Streptomyces sp. NBC_00075 TaxID=2975641 RepID=UPI0032442F0E